MKAAIPFLAMTLFLTGCTVGTEITGRDVDTSQPFPDLHTVPDRPPAPDFVAVELEREDFEEGHESMMELNRVIRNKYKAPQK